MKKYVTVPHLVHFDDDSNRCLYRDITIVVNQIVEIQHSSYHHYESCTLSSDEIGRFLSPITNAQIDPQYPPCHATIVLQWPDKTTRKISVLQETADVLLNEVLAGNQEYLEWDDEK